MMMRTMMRKMRTMTMRTMRRMTMRTMLGVLILTMMERKRRVYKIGGKFAKICTSNPNICILDAIAD